MASLLILLPDDLKERLRVLCLDYDKSMSSALVYCAEKLVDGSILLPDESVSSRAKCQLCGLEWSPRGGKLPLACPGCKSYKWNDSAAADQAGASKLRRAESKQRKEFTALYKLLGVKTEFRSAAEISGLCGVPVDVLAECYKGIIQVTEDMLVSMRGAL